MRRFVVIFFFFQFQANELCHASNILLISGVGSHSHSIWCNKLAEMLVNRGHRVTLLDTDPPRIKMANLTTYLLEGGYDYAQNVDYLKISLGGTAFAVDFHSLANAMVCQGMINSPTFKRFLAEHSDEEKPFDLMIHDVSAGECFLGLVAVLGNPKLAFVTAFGEALALQMMRSDGHLVHTPMYLSPLSHPMTFKEKLKNLYYNLYNYFKYYKYLSDMDSLSKEVFGSSTPHISEIGRSAAVALTNSHPIIDGAKYYSPAIVHIPGFHIDEPKKLNKETQTFLDGAKHGAIYFSLGTNILSTKMPKDIINMFLKVFGRLKQRVLWKLEIENMQKLPSNVKISKWFPQNDILAHPNIKVFITHCGLLSVQEAVYHGVPMVGIPFWLDQHVYANKLSKQGVVSLLPYASLSEQSIHGAIQEVLTNTSYDTEVKKISKIFKDRPIKPKELAAFWIEHVLRNDNHTYLQPPEAFLSRLELFLFDLKTILGIIIGLIISFLIGGRNKGRKIKEKRH